MAEKAPDIIVISDSESDSEREDNKKNPEETGKLFDEFFDRCHELLSEIREESKVQKVEKHLMKVYKAARKDYVISEEFTNSLRHHLTELRKPGLVTKCVFTHIHDVVVLLKRVPSEVKCKKEKTADQKVGECEKAANRDSETDNLSVKTCESDLEDIKPFVGEGSKVVTSSHEQNAERSSKENDSRVTEDDDGDFNHEPKNLKCKKTDDDAQTKKIRRLERLMGKLDKAISKYSEKELSVDELDREDSSHIIEHKLRKRFVEAWQKWCKLKGYEAKSGRAIEKKLKFQGTRYPEINRKIQKLINKGRFPDFHDVVNVINRANKKWNLKIHRFDVHQLSKEVFEDIGEKIRMQRVQDHISNFGYGNLMDAPADPANENESLKAKLEENANLGRQMMDSVFEKYTQKQNDCMSRGIQLEEDKTSEPEAIDDGEEEEEGEWEEMDDDDDSSADVVSGEENEVEVVDDGTEDGEIVKEDILKEEHPEVTALKDEVVMMESQVKNTSKRPLDSADDKPPAKVFKAEDESLENLNLGASSSKVSKTEIDSFAANKVNNMKDMGDKPASTPTPVPTSIYAVKNNVQSIPVNLKPSLLNPLTLVSHPPNVRTLSGNPTNVGVSGKPAEGKIGPAGTVKSLSCESPVVPTAVFRTATVSPSPNSAAHVKSSLCVEKNHTSVVEPTNAKNVSGSKLCNSNRTQNPGVVQPNGGIRTQNLQRRHNSGISQAQKPGSVHAKQTQQGIKSQKPEVVHLQIPRKMNSSGGQIQKIGVLHKPAVNQAQNSQRMEDSVLPTLPQLTLPQSADIVRNGSTTLSRKKRVQTSYLGALKDEPNSARNGKTSSANHKNGVSQKYVETQIDDDVVIILDD